MKCEVEILKTSIKNHSIFIIRRPNDCDHVPSVQIQVPTDIAMYLKDLIEHDNWVAEAKQLMSRNMKITAINLCRQKTCMTVREAKDFVESM